LKQQFLKGKTDTIRLTVYQYNRPLIPTTAKITLYKPDGTELQAQANGSVDATTGEMTYALTAIHTADHDLNYKAIWEYVVSSITYYETQLFDVVKSILSIPITDDDLYNELPSLRKANTQASGTATGGASGTLIDTTRRKEVDDYWSGGKIVILAGTNAGQERDITDFVQSTGVISVTPNWAATPDTTSIYQVVKSFSAQIQNSFNKLETMIYNKGKRHELILESSQITFPLVYLTLNAICLDLMDDENDKWDRLAKEYQVKFEKAFNSMVLEYDTDESGAIDDEEGQKNQNELRIGRA